MGWVEEGFEEYWTIMIKNIKPNTSYSLWEYILRLFLLVVVIFGVFITLSNDRNPLEGFIFSSISFLLITVAAVVLLLRERKWILFFVFAYLVHLGIGLGHYLLFLDSSYFITDGLTLPLPHDFNAALDAVNDIVSSKRSNGLFYYNDYYIGHPEIWNFISYPFYFFGAYILNIAALNSFMSVFTAINILVISKYKFNFSPNQYKRVAILAAYFPLTLISSIFFRDTTGIALMSLGLVIIILSKKNIIKYIMLLIAMYLFYIQRTIYPLVLLMAFMIDFLVNRKKRISTSTKILSFIVFIPVFIIFLRWSFVLGLSEGNNSSYIKGASNVNYTFLPIKLLMGIAGPFPWTQYFTTGRIEYSYQFADYLQGTLNITIVALVITYFHYFFKRNQFNLINLTGLILIASGLATSFMHSTYVSLGVLFLIPWIINSSSWIKLKKYYLIIFMGMLISSLLITAFLGALGLGGLWK